MSILALNEKELSDMTVHPLIHLGCGLEFNQPALILEALAETAVSTPSVEDFLSFTQEKAISAGNPSTKSLVQILQEVSIDGKIISVTTWDEPNKFENGPHKKAKEELAAHAKELGSVLSR